MGLRLASKRASGCVPVCRCATKLFPNSVTIGRFVCAAKGDKLTHLVAAMRGRYTELDGEIRGELGVGLSEDSQGYGWRHCNVASGKFRIGISNQ